MKRTGCYLQTNIPLLDDHMGGKESQLLCTVSKGVKQEPQSRASVERYSPFGQLMGDFLASVSCGPWVRPLSGKSSQHPGILQKHFQTPHFPLEKTSNCLCLFMSPAHLGSSLLTAWAPGRKCQGRVALSPSGPGKGAGIWRP